MITHYDMDTGERLEDDRKDVNPCNDSRPPQAAEPRLMTVQEAVAIEQHITAAPPAVIMMPLDLFFEH